MRKLHPDFEIVYAPQIHSQAYVIRSVHDRCHCTDPVRGAKKAKKTALQMQSDFELGVKELTAGSETGERDDDITPGN
jgi:hypothetical protein